MELTLINTQELRALISGLFDEKIIPLLQKPQEKEEDKLLTSLEAAEFLGVSLSTIHNRKRDGKIPFYRNGGKIAFKKSELLASCKKVQLPIAYC
jgi:excisionase family DNA binding protein